MMSFLNFRPLRVLALVGAVLVPCTSTATDELSDHRIPAETGAGSSSVYSLDEKDTSDSSNAAMSPTVPKRSSVQTAGPKTAADHEVRQLPGSAEGQGTDSDTSVGPMSDAERRELEQELTKAEAQQHDERIRRVSEAFIAMMQSHREIFARQANEFHRLFFEHRLSSRSTPNRTLRRNRTPSQRSRPFDSATEQELRRAVGDEVFFLLFGY